ncbi:MAG: hypothetical protein ACTHJQ_01450 [Rhizobiaceae bacterium]
MSDIIVRMADLCGRTEVGSLVSVRPSVCGATHSRHAGSDFPSLGIGADSFASASGAVAVVEQTGHRTAFNSSRLRLPGSLIPIGFHRALQVLQDALRNSADLLHFSPSAALRGLAVVFNGREDDRKKSKCPTKEFPGAEKIFPKRV